MYLIKGGANFPSMHTQIQILSIKYIPNHIFMYTFTFTYYIIQVISKMARKKSSDGLGEYDRFDFISIGACLF
jgi:hypothetical protein